MTVRIARSKRTRLANRRRLNAARPTEERSIPLLIVKPDGSYAPVVRPLEAARS